MRKLFLVVLLLGAFGLFAQIPVGTKEIGLEADIGDVLADDFSYIVQGYGGYFFMDNIEALLGVGVAGTTAELPTDFTSMVFVVKAGAYYHYMMSEQMGFFGGAWFGYTSGVVGTTADGYMYAPIDAGVEYFLNKSIGVRVFNRYQLNFGEISPGVDREASDHIMVAMFGIF